MFPMKLCMKTCKWMELFICMLMFLLIVADCCFRARRIACYQKRKAPTTAVCREEIWCSISILKPKKNNNWNIPPKQFSTILSPPIPYQKRSIYFIKYRESNMNTVVNKHMLQVVCFFVHTHCRNIIKDAHSLWLRSTHFLTTTLVPSFINYSLHDPTTYTLLDKMQGAFHVLIFCKPHTKPMLMIDFRCT